MKDAGPLRALLWLAVMALYIWGFRRLAKAAGHSLYPNRA